MCGSHLPCSGGTCKSEHSTNFHSDDDDDDDDDDGDDDDDD